VPPAWGGRLAALITCLILIAACGSSVPAPSTPVGTDRAPSAAPVSGPGESVGASPAGPSQSIATPSPVPPASLPPALAAEPFAYAAKGMTHEVMAFVTSGYVAREANRLDYGAISTVVEFGIEPAASGALIRTLPGGRAHPKWAAWTSRAMDQIIGNAHAAGTKVVPSIIRFSWSPAQTAVSRALLASPAARSRLVSETVAEVVRRGVDGVNLDFEPIPIGQRANFTALVRELRSALDRVRPGYQLTFAATGYYQSYDLAALLAPGGADALYLMGYHYRGTFSTSSGSTSPMGGPKYDVGDTFRAIRKVGVPADRIILGVPFYGHMWPTAGSAINARTIGPGRDVLYGEGVSLAADHGAALDPVEGVMWGAFQDRACATCSAVWWQFYVDDATTLARKWAFVNANGLLGTGIWAAGYEGDHPEPWAAIRAAFVK
jgi:spore germination protein YaaH